MSILRVVRRMECPECGSGMMHRSRRKGVVEKVLCGVLPIHPYRCNDCDYRFFRLRLANSAEKRRPA